MKRPNIVAYCFAGGSLLTVLAGCAMPPSPSNAHFTLRVSGPAGEHFDGQCSSRVLRLISGESTDGLTIEGTITPDGVAREFNASGVDIYCGVNNETGNGELTVELVKDGVTIDQIQVPPGSSDALGSGIHP
jgi:hypothetical protein